MVNSSEKRQRFTRLAAQRVSAVCAALDKLEAVSTSSVEYSEQDCENIRKHLAGAVETCAAGLKKGLQTPDALSVALFGAEPESAPPAVTNDAHAADSAPDDNAADSSPELDVDPDVEAELLG